ncbi:uncharacterized protein EDB93DRAFT_142256 [Suillus bovinus]|uniref:uncharacterized protein n=1 Tax=Suillus bovinus TaxID=48563 RepID=UPI001B8666F1|nr:uncharacterized protein EDB93DRAFT_142256 [Suillus bovinus]KAG2129192.1 hypothetical protein EDB93DRAFT_142256 [Suillus bovinus]
MPTPSCIYQAVDSCRSYLFPWLPTFQWMPLLYWHWCWRALHTVSSTQGASSSDAHQVNFFSLGFSVLMFIGTIWALTYKQRIHDISHPITVVAILLFILSTAHMIVNIIRVEDGLVKYRDTFPGGPVAFFADPSQYTFTIGNALYVLQTLLADGVVIYRCYIVWQSVWVIVVPSMLWCSVAVSGVAINYTLSQVTSDFSQIYENERGTPAHWVNAFYVSAIATNLLSSALLAYRIWMVERNVSTIRAKKNTMVPIVRVLVDSAVLYSVALFTALITYVCSNNGQNIILDMLAPIISIAFYMVLIRIAINRRHHSHTNDETELGNLQRRPMQPLQVHVLKILRDDSNAVCGIGNRE